MKQLQLVNVENNITEKPKSKYQQWKLQYNYRKATDCNKCKNCQNLCVKDSKYYKCIMLGISGSSATDIRINNTCDLFIPNNADCQLCKHLDCDSEGNFICSLDGEVLDHEGICCNKFEEYKE